MKPKIARKRYTYLSFINPIAIPSISQGTHVSVHEALPNERPPTMVKTSKASHDVVPVPRDTGPDIAAGFAVPVDHRDHRRIKAERNDLLHVTLLTSKVSVPSFAIDIVEAGHPYIISSIAGKPNRPPERRSPTGDPEIEGGSLSIQRYIGSAS